MSQHMEHHRIGQILPPIENNEEFASDTLLAWIEKPRELLDDNFLAARHGLGWSECVQPLVTFCRSRATEISSSTRAATQSSPVSTIMSQYEQVVLVAENKRLKALVEGYESGRIMRALKWIKGKSH